MTTRNRKNRVLAALVSGALIFGATAFGGTAPAFADSGLCQTVSSAADGLRAQVESIKSRIAAHNSQPVNRYDAGAVNAYNAEAAQLNAERDAINAQILAAGQRVSKCNTAARQLETAGPPMNPLTQADKQALTNANANVPKGWTPPTTLPQRPNGNVYVPKDSPVRPHFDIMDKRQTPLFPYPNIQLQGKSMPTPTQINEATGQPYGEVTRGPRKGQAAVSPDHIVPKAEIMQMPRFTELTPDQQWAIVNSPSNLAWVGTRTNFKKGSRDVAAMSGVKPEWQAKYKQLQDDKRREIQDLINQFADSNAGK